jgi:hypothetical protein
MATNFFSRFPKIDYNMDGQGSFLTLTNIVKNVDVNDFYSNGSTYYTYYTIEDGERPDTVSYKLYGTPNYYWTLFILNNDLRDGLNGAWPLSNQQMERMLEREYEPYSVITFLPSDDVLRNGTGQSGLMNLVYLWDAYLPYLRLVNSSSTERAKILKYSGLLLQLIVHSIENMDGSPASSRDSFIKLSPTYTLSWVNPFDSESLDADEVARWAECDRLRLEFIDRTIEVYKEFDEFADAYAILGRNDGLEGLTTEQIATAVSDYNRNYVFTKKYVPTKTGVRSSSGVISGSMYRWSSYRDAASEYYETVDEENRTMSAYDIVLNSNVIEANYISFFEKEEAINARKTQIRAIRPDKIVDFVNAYFNTLNAR